MAYCVPDDVLPFVGFNIDFSASQWDSYLRQASGLVDGYTEKPYDDDTVYTIVDETHYDPGPELRLKRSPIIGIDEINYFYEDVLGWIRLPLPSDAYMADANGLVLLRNVLMLQNPKVIKVTYKHINEDVNIPRYIRTASAMMCASIILSQPMNLINDENLKQLSDRFGGELDKVKSVSIEGISVSFESVSAANVIGEIQKSMKENAKELKASAIEILRKNRYRPIFD